MRTMIKFAGAVTLAAALAVAASTPSQARHGRNGALLGGFVAGAVIGAAAANAGAYDGYYYGPGPGYAYAPGPAYDDGSYAYEPGPVYVAPRPRSCWHSTDDNRGYGYYGSCY